MAGGAARQPYRGGYAIGAAVVPHRRFSKGRRRSPRQHGPGPPWSAAEVVFGMTAPEPVAGERIVLTVAATSQQKIEPLLRFATGAGAASVAGLVEAGDGARATKPIRVFQ